MDVEVTEPQYNTNFLVTYTVTNKEGSILMGNAIASITGQLEFISLDVIHNINAIAMETAVKTHGIDVKDIGLFVLTGLIPLGACTSEEFLAK